MELKVIFYDSWSRFCKLLELFGGFSKFQSQSGNIQSGNFAKVSNPVTLYREQLASIALSDP
jgi:hypothetical protein